MYDEIKNIHCETCNGACCKIFKLRYSKLDLLKMIFGIKKHVYKLPNIRQEFIKQFLWLKDVSKTPFAMHLKSTFKDDEFKYFYTCKKLSKNGKCKAYKKRLLFCYNYTCYGASQLAHQTLNGQPLLPRLNIYKEDTVYNEVKKYIEAEPIQEATIQGDVYGKQNC